MSTILEILERTAADLRIHVDATAETLAGGPDLDVLREAARRYEADEADALRRLDHARRELAATRDRIADRQRAEAEHHEAQQMLAQTIALMERHRRAVEPPAQEAIAATGLMTAVRPDVGTHAVDEDLPFNVTQAPPETVAAITGGTPIITDPDHLESGSPIVTATDPVTHSTGEPRHAKPKQRGTGPLRLLHRNPATTGDTGDDATKETSE